MEEEKVVVVPVVAEVPAVEAAPVETLVEETEPEIAHEQPAGTVFDLSFPDFVPASEQTPERMALLDSFSGVAPSAGMNAEDASSAVAAFVDVATSIPSNLDVEHATIEEVVSEMQSMYGEGEATSIINRAQNYTAKWPALKAWLESTGLGNDPAVIATLAFAQGGTLRCSPAQAQARIDKLMKDGTSAYHSSDSKKRLLAVAEVQILSRIAERGSLSPEAILNNDARGQRPTPFVSVRATNEGRSVAANATTARAELATMMKKGTPLMDGSHRDHAAAVKTYLALLAKI